MPPIPVLRPRDVIKAFEKLGWEVSRAEGDYLEVLFSDKAGYMKETNNEAVMERVDAQGNVLGFTVMGDSRLAKDKPLIADLIPA